MRSAVWFFFLGLVTSGGAAEAPNVVFVLADDLGYGDVRALNPDSGIPTPHLDSLAADGMNFTDAHSPSSVCTPTRYGILTGRYSWRTRLKRGVLNGYGKPLIEGERTTVGEWLRDAGYATSIVGKWHLGLGFAEGEEPRSFDFTKPLSDTPVDHGFDRSYVLPASLDFPPYVYIEGREIVEFPSIQEPGSAFPDFWRAGERSPDFIFEESLDHLTEKAAGEIRTLAGQEKPFFLYFPLTAPHKPATPHPRFRGKSGLGPYGDFILQVDWTVGEVLRAIDEAGICENTLVVVSSDNGSYMYRRDEGETDHVDKASDQGYRAEHHRANGAWRGTKADIWEAGHRVPFLVRWPAVIEKGSRCEETVCLVDFFATVAEASGEPVSEGETAPDSFSMMPLFRGHPWERAPVIHHSLDGMFAIREGKWKLVLGNGSGGRERPKGQPFKRPYALFDLEADPGETKDLIDARPEVAQRLEAAALAIRDGGSSRL